MDRRRFLQGTLAGATVLSPTTAEQSGAVPPEKTTKKVLLKAGHQNHSTDADLRVLAALGVNHICSSLPSRTFDQIWSAEGLPGPRERVERFGIKLDMVPLPLSSSYISGAENPHIMMGKSPERAGEIKHISKRIRNAAKAGTPAVKYNLT